MRQAPVARSWGLWLVLLTIAFNACAQQADNQITLSEPSLEDQYLAGESITVLAPIDGDLIAAAQRLVVEAPIGDDVIAVGERIGIRANVGDDVRLAGRQVDITASVADDAVIAGETVTLSAEARVGNRLWLAGRLVEVSGNVGDELRAAGQTIVISGTIGGDALLTGQRIEILPGARIGGNLVYRSNEPAVIADGAVIAGTVERKPLDMPERPDVPAWPFIIGLLLSLLICFNVLYWLLPKRMHGAAGVIRHDVFRALGVGLAVVLVTPVLAALLVVTLLGMPLGFALLLLYPVILLLGFAAGILWLAKILLALARQGDGSTTGQRFVGVLAALMVYAVSQLVPLVGTLFFLFLLLGGTGALVMAWRRDRAEPVAG